MDDDDEERERLDMKNDYEGLVEINGTYLYKSKKQRRVQTADEKLYGVFAEEASSDEEGGRRFGKKGKKADYSRPVSFVSTGVGMGSADAKPQPVPDNAGPQYIKVEDAKGVKVEDNGQKGFGGLSFRLSSDATAGRGSMTGLDSHTGLGATNGAAAHSSSSRSNPSFVHGHHGGAPADYDEEEEELVLPNAFGRQVLNDVQRKEREKKANQVAEKKRQKTAASGVGDFEKHTKGIGQKMMKLMGYKPGEGLGRNKQGISTAIEARQRPKLAGLGHGERPEASKPDPVPAASQAKMVAEQPKRLWSKRSAAQQQKRQYRTAAEVLEAADGEGGAGSRAPPATTILDLRGPQARVVTNMENLNADHETEAGEDIPMPELQHNLKLLVDLAEADLRRLDARLRFQQDTAVVLARDKARLEEAAEEAAAAEQKLSEVAAVVEHCGSAPMDLSDVAAAYSQLRIRYPEEYVMYNLAAAALAQVLPRIQAAMAAWQPLEQPADWAPQFRQWRALLESDLARDAIFQDSTALESDPYQTLVSAVVVPRLQSALGTAWVARNPEPLLKWMDVWEMLLPPAVLRQILETLVFPKLQTAVEEWEPLRERTPLHSWLHPWLPMLGTELTALHPSIRHKLSVALTRWQPSDRSALAILSPWQRVFDAKSWEALLMRSILPKLAAGLAGLIIDPSNQPPHSLSPWHDAMAWQPYLAPGQAAGLLESAFWAQWHNVLTHWLTNSPDMDQVVAWFSGWKALMPQDLRDSERVRYQLNVALNSMHHVGQSSAPQRAAAPQYQWQQEQSGQPTASPAPQQPAAAPDPPESRWDDDEGPSMRGLVQDFAAEHSIAFAPKADRTERGLQVYGFGGVSITMDPTLQLVRALMGDRWAPVTLDGLLTEQKARAQQKHRVMPT